jgi:hypothetical protein
MAHRAGRHVSSSVAMVHSVLGVSHQGDPVHGVLGVSHQGDPHKGEKNALDPHSLSIIWYPLSTSTSLASTVSRLLPLPMVTLLHTVTFASCRRPATCFLWAHSCSPSLRPTAPFCRRGSSVGGHRCPPRYPSRLMIGALLATTCPLSGLHFSRISATRTRHAPSSARFERPWSKVPPGRDVYPDFLRRRCWFAPSPRCRGGRHGGQIPHLRTNVGCGVEVTESSTNKQHHHHRGRRC